MCRNDNKCCAPFAQPRHASFVSGQMTYREEYVTAYPPLVLIPYDNLQHLEITRVERGNFLFIFRPYMLQSFIDQSVQNQELMLKIEVCFRRFGTVECGNFRRV